jgi:valyl-tRNA synthetase
MSKTRRNVLDPLEVTEEYGTDATRFTLAIMAAPGTDIALSPDRLRSYRAFANKIWNAARFIALNRQRAEAQGVLSDDFVSEMLAEGPPENRKPTAPSWVDAWLASRLHRLSLTINQALEEFRYHEAAHEVYHFFWHEFCDWYLEWVKPMIAASVDNKNPAPSGVEQQAPPSAGQAAWRNLLTHFEWALRLLHPFMPFITEELWRDLYDSDRSLAVQAFPQGNADAFDEKTEQEMALVQEAITALRNIRAEMRLDARRRIPGELSSADQAILALFRAHRETILRLVNLSTLDLAAGTLPAAGGVLRHTARFDARIAYTEADLAAELKRLSKEKEKLEKELNGMRARLADRQFREKAPEKVVRGLEQRQAEFSNKHEKVTKLLNSLETGSDPAAPA